MIDAQIFFPRILQSARGKGRFGSAIDIRCFGGQCASMEWMWMVNWTAPQRLIMKQRAERGGDGEWNGCGSVRCGVPGLVSPF